MWHFSDCEHGMYHKIIIAFQIVIIYSFFLHIKATKLKLKKLANDFYQFKLPYHREKQLKQIIFCLFIAHQSYLDKGKQEFFSAFIFLVKFWDEQLTCWSLGIYSQRVLFSLQNSMISEGGIKKHTSQLLYFLYVKI